MVPLGEGASVAPSASAYEGGGEGVGGKFRKRPFRKPHTTPYDRPSTALRKPSWLSKLLVDPASKLIAASAQRFFSPIFRKRLPPPPQPPPESNQNSSGRHPEAVLKAEAREPAVGDGENFNCGPDGGIISELEQLLKQKTFTRSEIDRLTELLHSRAVDLSVEDGIKRTEANTSKLVANFEAQQQLVIPSEEKSSEIYRSHGLKSTLGTSTKVLEGNIASPAEIAKAYMDNQVSKVSPSVLGLRSRGLSRGLWEDATLPSYLPFSPKSTVMSSTKANAHVEVPGNGFMTSRSRERSAIYNMARTPYSRVHATALEKGSDSRNYASGGTLLPTLSLKEPDGQLGSRKLVPKRRSSVLDEDLVSSGPMRRIRQKHNLLSPNDSLSHGSGGVSDAVQRPSSLKKIPSTDEWKPEGPKAIGKNDGNLIQGTSYPRVPPKSSEMAARIFEHLEKMTPKEKSAESKLIAAREKTPAKLTTDMLHGQALKSLEDMDYSNLLQNNQDDHKLENWSHSISLSPHASAPAKEDRSEAYGSQKLDSQPVMTPVENSHITAFSVKGGLSSVETSNSVLKSVAQNPQKKRAFMMSAHEDSLELDDDIKSNGPASEPPSEGKENQEDATYKNTASAEKLLKEKTAALPEIWTPPESISGKRSDLEIGNAANEGEKTDVSFPISIASSPTSQLVTLPPSALGLENSEHEVTAFHSPLPSSVTGILGSKPFHRTDQIPEISSSSDGVDTGILGSEKGNDNNAEEAAKSNGKLGSIHSVASSSVAYGSISPNVPISSSNGPISISTSTFSSPLAPASNAFAGQLLSNNISNLASSPSTVNSAATTSASTVSNSSPVLSTAVPSSPVMPMFKFGASFDSSTSASPPGAEALVLKTKTEKEADFGSSTSNATVATYSNIFGLSSTITSSTANSQSQGSFSSTGSESMFSSESSVAGPGTGSATHGMPAQFGFSASSPVFGTSGVACFTSSNTVSSSSTTATKSFGTGTDFGLSASASSVETKSVASGSGATSSLLGFGVNDPSSSSVAILTSSSGGNVPAIFSFGANSLATTSVVNTSSSSSGATPIFSFGFSNAVSSVSSGSSSIFSVNPSSSSSESNHASSSSAASSVFGSCWQASTSPRLSSTFNSSHSTGFSFSSSNTASMVFGSSTGASSGSVSPFSTASAKTTSPSLFNAPPGFGNSTPAFTASGGNNDQMSTEDSMAEDPVQSSTPAVPAFCQPPASPSPNGSFVFASTVPSHTTPFQFGQQQSLATSQNPSPFQASGSLEFNARGGSFSLSSGGLGGDKSGRKIVRVNRNRNRKAGNC